jgi:hypothetical protein
MRRRRRASQVATGLIAADNEESTYRRKEYADD